MSVNQTIATVEDLLDPELRVIGGISTKHPGEPKVRVSKKYVPIYTDEIVKYLSPEFKFQRGTRFFGYCNAHSVDLDYNGDKLIIENSYDLSRAFSFKYKDAHISIPLDLERQLHIGIKATKVADGFKNNKGDIITAINSAKTIVEKLKTVPALKLFRSDIRKIVFKEVREKEGFSKVNHHTVPARLENASVYEYVNYIVDNYFIGKYTYRIKDPKSGLFVVKAGRATKSPFVRLKITNNVYDYLHENYVEAFI